ncbi:Di-copper centre-containing protein [Periconia macrospinosa]|uniref:Di-copper centre-containing protein n=1 Tax=Periconia macrospinosa TaxID=97972 RepID=A0A2V1CZI9_9PLEO|nr:Di-copper centre-containing protein [Periconia macrospinosa]
MRLTWILFAIITADAAPVHNGERAACTSPIQRKAWHTLTREEKKSYIDAEKCLMSLPAKLGLAGPRTRFDEFQKIHVLHAPLIHGVGAFLPYHRYYVQAHETALRTECSYAGAQPYWDEPRDAGNFSKSILLDPETGFGGDGVGPNNCIADGPFKDYMNSVGPGESITDHCIDRQINDCWSEGAAQKNVDACMKITTFESAWNCLEGMPHRSGHRGINGQMMDVFSSPGDPLFYMHHAYLDKLWWQWQSKNLSSRLNEVTGPNQGTFFIPGGVNGRLPIGSPNGTIPGGPNGTFPPFGPFPPGNGSDCNPVPGGFPGFPRLPPPQNGPWIKIDGDPANITTLGHVINVEGMIPNVTIKDVMDIQGDVLCYEYV